jgi:hypothetical protein
MRFQPLRTGRQFHFPFWLALQFACLLSVPAFAQTWKLIQPIYATAGTFVAGFSVADYGATGDGVTDVTGIFQDRLNALSNLGGGTLFVPKGKYVIKGNLLIPKGITLRGEWQKPVKGQAIVGTILLAYAGRGDETATPFITMQTSAAVLDLSIWYPEQSPSSITPYPPSIIFGSPNYFGNEFCNAKNITFVNSYTGLVFSRTNGGTCPIINGLYGTPLSRGVEIDNIVDTGHLENINFSPAYWEGSGLAGSPASGSAMESWVYQNGTGIVMRRNDWSYTSFVSIEGYNKGFYTAPSIASPGATPNGSNYSLTFTHCKTGLYLEADNNVGTMFSRVTTTNCETGIYVGPNTNGVLQFHTSTLAGTTSAVEIAPASQTRLMLQQCTIGQGVVHAAGGTLTASDCDFNNASPQVTLDANSRGIITANRFKNPVKIQNNSTYLCAIDQTPVTINKLPSFPVIVPEIHKPSSTAFYVVTDAAFGAKPDGVTDNTTAIQSALNRAASGGGVVFLPPGKYKVLGNLSVPTGVELKGSVDNSSSATGTGSILEVYANRGNEGGTPFMQLAASSGVRGITFDYPEQISTQLPGIPAYPYCLQVKGSNAYIINVAMRAVYNGVDLFTYKCDNHYVDFLAGHVFRRGITVGGKSTGGKIYNSQFNVISYAAGSESKFGSWPNSPAAGNQQAYDYAFATLEFLTVGDCTSETLFNNFVYGANKGVIVGTPTGVGPTGSSLGMAIDGTRTSMSFLGAGATPFDFISNQLVALGDTTTRYLNIAPTFKSTVNLYGADCWGNPGRGIMQSGGTLNLQLGSFNQPGQMSFAAVKTASTFNVYNSSICPVRAVLDKGSEPHFSAQSSIVDSTHINITKALAWKNNLTNPWIYGGGPPVNLPGQIEAENYNAGGQGVAYNDSDPVNIGGQYRPTEGVDIEGCSEGGYDIGFIQPGEWLKYDVNVTQAGPYLLEVRLAAPSAQLALHVEVDGVNVSGPITAPNTGGYQIWQTVAVTTTPLTVGAHTVRVYMDGTGFNFNYLKFSIPSSPLAGQTLTLQANNGLFVSSENGGGPMNSNRTAVGPWEQFLVVDAGSGTVALKNSGKYVSSQNGQQAITCQDTVISALNHFALVFNSDGTLSLRGSNGLYVSSENGTAPMTCNRTAIGSWEEFNYTASGATAALRKTNALAKGATTDALGATEITAYPNPVVNQLTYVLPPALQSHVLSVHSLTGQLLFQQTYNTASSVNTVDASAWPAGVYIVTVAGNNLTKNFKIVKQ